MNAADVQGLTSDLLKTFPVKVTVWPESVSVFSTYMFASIVLLPTAPGPPPGVYQKGFGSPIVLGESVRTGPANVAHRSAVPQPLPNTKPPPFAGISNTFMKPSQVSAG